MYKGKCCKHNCALRFICLRTLGHCDKAKEEAEAKAKAGPEQKAKEEADAKAKEEVEAKAK